MPLPELDAFEHPGHVLPDVVHTGRAPTAADYERWAQRDLEWELEAVIMESLHGDWGDRD